MDSVNKASERERTNRLIYEKSPYLLQHAYNPVKWYPWGEEAFQKAREENKLIFLSIGYSTCHWCHVMAHESFEDEEAAEVINRNFVAVKVDKEERPDIDAVYMEVCQIMTGQGGWPLTILMTPEQKPVFAGTYVPKRPKYGQFGLIELLETFSSAWKENPQKLMEESEKITAYLYRDEQKKDNTEINKEILEGAAGQFAQMYDDRYGGFGKAPKFPSPHNILFLLRYAQFENDDKMEDMACHTLISMYRGGIFDHVGGGFSRYSVDKKWLAPHFEKMLYDNALLAYVYLEAYQITRREIFRQIAKRVLQYVLRELTHGQGGFYCGQDADSEGEEGKYYLFDKSEIMEVLGDEKGEIYCSWYGISQEGNFEGKNILNLIGNDEFETPNPRIAGMNQLMEEYRAKRMKLHRDDKILTSWNGLMIAAFAKGYQVLQDESYLRAARRAEEFAANTLTREDGRLYIRYREGECAGEGQLDHLTGELIWGERAGRQLKFLAGNAHRYPTGCSQTLLAMMEEIYAYRELVITAEEEEDFVTVKEMLSQGWNGNLAILCKTPENAEKLANLCPYTENYPIANSGAVYYLCQDGACMPPIKEIEKLREVFKRV